MKKGKPAIYVETQLSAGTESEYRYSKWFKVQRMLSTGTQSGLRSRGC